MRRIDCAYVRLVDTLAIALWTVAFALLIVDHFTAAGQPTWLSRWSVMVGMLATTVTLAAVGGWIVRELSIREGAQLLDDLVARRSRK